MNKRHLCTESMETMELTAKALGALFSCKGCRFSRVAQFNQIKEYRRLCTWILYNWKNLFDGDKVRGGALESYLGCINLTWAKS